jgi:phage FluMu gp28-like protein
MSELKNKTVLRPYQRRWVTDRARLALAVKAAQIGYSTASAAWAVITCLARPQQLVVLLSRSERQSLELAEKCKLWVDGYRGVLADYFPNQWFAPGPGALDQARRGGSRTAPTTSTLQHEIRFPNRSRIIALAANPDTARGYSGHVVLDEFAFHADAEAIFKAAYRQTTLGYSLKVLSTPNGQQGKFFEIAKSLGLDSGIRPRRQPVRQGVGSRELGVGADSRFPIPDSRPSPWSGHWCDIHLAVEEGAPIDIPTTRAGCDEDTWLQEYCCQFVSQASEWISAELFQSSVSSEASADFRNSKFETRNSPSGELRASSFEFPLYAGWDIARKRDLSVIWISELVGDVTWTRGVIEMAKMSTVEQVREVRGLLGGGAGGELSAHRAIGSSGHLNGQIARSPDGPIPKIRRMNIDMSGMGLAMVEQLQREFPDQVEGVEFTASVKERLAVVARRRMEEGKVRLPEDPTVRHAFRAVRKAVNAAGQARFDAGHDSDYGHADHFWAFALAEAAAEAAGAARRSSPHQASPVFVGRPLAEELAPMAMESVF